MPVTEPSITPRHTRHTDSEYAMPHREKHELQLCTPEQGKEDHKGRGGSSHNHHIWHYWKAACVTAHQWVKLLGRSACKEMVNGSRIQGRLCGEADWVQGFTRRSNQTSRLSSNAHCGQGTRTIALHDTAMISSAYRLSFADS
jgi:hypothetical protein